MLDLLETMTEYCSTSAARQYVLRLAFFNENGVLVQYNPTSIRSAGPEIELFLQSQPYRTIKETGAVANMGLPAESGKRMVLPIHAAGLRADLRADRRVSAGRISTGTVRRHDALH